MAPKIPRAASSMVYLPVGVALLVLLVLFPGLLLGQPIVQVPSLVPLVAQSAGAPTPFPDHASFSFEDSTTTTFTSYGTMTPPANSWASWTMHGSSGIAANGSSITSMNPNTVDGTRVAFLQGTGSIETSVTLQPGTWRLKFKGAQRVQPAGPDQQVVRVSMGGTSVSQLDFVGITFNSYITRPISVDTATSMSVVFTGLDPDSTGATALIDTVELQRIAEWDIATTWGGRVPNGNFPTIIPANVAVAIRGTGNIARNLRVAGELLVSNRDSDLTAEWVMVAGANSLFEVGQE